MNKVFLIGRATRDTEVRYADTGTAIAGIGLAVKRDYVGKDGVDVDFFDCTAFGKNAEFAEKYIVKGMKILVEGRMQTGSYENKQGVTVKTYNVIVERFEFVESKKTASGAEPESTQKQSRKTNRDNFVSVPDGIDEELPFN